MKQPLASQRSQLFADPTDKFLHDVVLESCRRHAEKIAIIDTSCTPASRITYAAYGEMVERAARGLVAAGIRPGEVIGIFLPNCWEFGVAYHAATLAGAIPTTLNPTYREREVRYQLETADAVALDQRRHAADRHRPERSAAIAAGVHGARARPQRIAWPSIPC